MRSHFGWQTQFRKFKFEAFNDGERYGSDRTDNHKQTPIGNCSQNRSLTVPKPGWTKAMVSACLRTLR